MSSITEQKKNLMGLIHELPIERYRKMTKQQREDAFLATLVRYSTTKTLRQLEQWHTGLHIQDMVKEQWGNR